MMQLRAVVAANTSDAAAAPVGLDPNTTRSAQAKKSAHEKRNANIEKRIQKDKDEHDVLMLQSNIKKMKHVKSSLEKKAELYNNLYSEGGTDHDNREFMVDFSRKRNLKDSNNLQSSGASTTELVQITDEFGRYKMVKENSAEYRLFLATESRKLRMEEIQDAPGFGRGDGVNGQLGWNVDGVQQIPSAASVAVQRNYGCYSRNNDSIQIPYEHDSKRYDYRPMNHFEKDEVRNINGCLENQRAINGGASIAAGGNGKTSRRDKREARLALIREKSKKRKGDY